MFTDRCVHRVWSQNQLLRPSHSTVFERDTREKGRVEKRSEDACLRRVKEPGHVDNTSQTVGEFRKMPRPPNSSAMRGF
jgi:hypothetical protein